MSTKITAKQQAAIDATRAFFLENEVSHDDGVKLWKKAEKAIEAARKVTYIEKPEVPQDSQAWRLDTIVRDSYFDLREIGLTDEQAYDAVCDL